MKKTVSVFSSLLLAGSMLLSGCSSGTTASSSTAASANASVPSAAASLSDGKITDSDVTLTLTRSDNPNQPMKDDSAAIQQIYKKTGVKLKINAIPGSDFATKQSVMLATADMSDILYDTYDVGNYSDSGIFVDLSSKFDIMPNLAAKIKENPQIKKCYIDGKLYYAPELARNFVPLARLPMIRQDLLKKLNLQTPQTFDELYNVLLAIKKAYPNTYPLANRNGTGNLFTCFGYSMGSGNEIYYDYDVDGGTWRYAPLYPEFSNMLAYMNKLYKNGILDPDYATCTSTQWQQKLSSGKSSFFFDNPSFALNFNKALKTNDTNAQFGVFAIPKNDSGVSRGVWYAADTLAATTISAKSANVDVACKFVDWLYSDEGCDITNYGEEGVQYTKSGDTYTIKPDVVSKYTSQSDPWRAFCSDTGTGELGLARYIDFRTQYPFMTDDQKTMYDSWKDFKLADCPVTPAFTTEENEQIKTLSTSVTTILNSEYDKFIMGQKPISDWSKVVAEISDNAKKIEQIYNTAEKRSDSVK